MDTRDERCSPIPKGWHGGPAPAWLQPPYWLQSPSRSRLLPRSRCGPGCSLLRHLQPHPRPPVWIVADETTRVVSYLRCAPHTATLLSGLQGGTSVCRHVAARAFILQESQVLGLLGLVPSQPQSGGHSAVGWLSRASQRAGLGPGPHFDLA